MAQLVKLQDSWGLGMKQDLSRTAMPRNSAWNLVDYIPNLSAPLRKRGGWSYGSDSITATKATASYVWSVVYATFSAAAKLCAIDEDGELYTINTSTNAVTDVGAAVTPLQMPVLHSDKLIIPASDGTTAPKYYDGTTLGNLAGSPPAGKYVTVYKDRTVLANTASKMTRAYFSGAADPTTWDTTNSWLSMLSPITGLAALPNALLVFQDRSTARVRGSIPPPGSDMIVDDPIFAVGCTDARSIAVNGDYCVFANPRGVYLSNGTNIPEDLTQTVGLKRYWIDLLASYAASSWTLAGGFIRNNYVVSVMNGSSFVDCLVFDIQARVAYRLGNIKATSFGPAVTVGEELFFGVRSAARVGKMSTIFSPAAGVKNDADGTAVAPVLETPFFYSMPGKKTWKSVYATFDMRDAASDNPVLTVSYIKNPQDSYTDLATTLAESADYTRAKLALRFPADGVAFKFAQTNASSDTRLYVLQADVHSRESSRL